MQSKGFFMLVTTTSVTFLIAFMIDISSIASGSTQKSGGDDAQQTYTFVKKWGGAGTEDGKFLRPHDLDFSPDEKILYIVDRDGNRIQAFNKNGTFSLRGAS